MPSASRWKTSRRTRVSFTIWDRREPVASRYLGPRRAGTCYVPCLVPLESQAVMDLFPRHGRVWEAPPG